MSYDTDRYLFQHAESTALFLTECGIQICHKGHAVPMLKYPDYSAHFILEGSGVYEIGGKRHFLSAGDGFMIKPGDLCAYTAAEREPWKYVYISFRGTQADALVESADLKEKNTFSFDNTSEMQALIYKMHAIGKENAYRGVDALGYFLIVMSRLIKKRNDKNEKKAEGIYLLRAKRYIEDNFALGIRVSDIALAACVERSYLYRLFMLHERCSPLAYLNKVRLNHARTLLTDQTLSVAEVADASGFFDASHLSKAFYAQFKKTPGEYRKSVTK